MSTIPIRLFTPGPTNIPPKVQEVLNKPLIHHRSKEFEAANHSIQQQFKELVGESSKSIFFTSSGSGAMEASVASLFEAGDEVVVVHAGKFGERWRDLCLTYDLKVKEFAFAWGKAADVEQIMDWVKQHNPKAVFIQACETSTGVFHPVYALGKYLKSTDTLLIVDAITALGIYPFSLEYDGIDVLIGGSQKALMCPPGLASLSLNAKAEARLLKQSRSYYFSIAKELKSHAKNSTAYTPAIPLFFALQAALDMILHEGVHTVHKRHEYLQQVTRAYFKSQNFTLLNEEHEAALGLTAVLTSEAFDVAAFIKQLKERFGIWIAGGQDELKGKLFRFAHMGYCYPEHLMQALEDTDQCLKSHKDYSSAALPAAQTALQRSPYENPHL